MRRELKKIMMMVGVAGCLVLSGCGSASDVEGTAAKSGTADYGFQTYNGYDETQSENSMETDEVDDTDAAEGIAEENVTDTSDTGNQTSQAQKIIKTYNFSYDTEKFDDAYQFLRKQVEIYGGYISDSDMNGTDLRNLRLTARIPVEQCDQFVSQLGNLGTATSQSESAEDITLQYNDTESRIASLKTEQQRLTELLKDADSLDTIVALEERLTEVRYQLENYQSQKNLYDDLITYSTVNISLYEVSYEVPVDDSTVFSRMKSGIVTSLRDISHSFVNFMVWFVSAVPYLVIWIFIIWIIYRIIRRIVRKRKLKKQQKMQGMMMGMQPQNQPVKGMGMKQQNQPVKGMGTQPQNQPVNGVDNQLQSQAVKGTEGHSDVINQNVSPEHCDLEKEETK